MCSKQLVHVFLVSFPAQGHVNPLLRLGKLIAAKGLLVTFSTTEDIAEQMRSANDVSGDPVRVGDGKIRFEFFDDGVEAGANRHDLDYYMPLLEVAGRRELTRMIEKHRGGGGEGGHGPVACLINNPFIPWVSDVAESLNIPSAMLWVQSCACFSAYFHFHHSLVPFPTETRPDIEVQLPKMPPLKHDEIPSFLHPSNPYPSLTRAILGQFKNLTKPFCTLVETFEELEDDLINYVSTLCPIKPVGPLFKNPSLKIGPSISGDFIKADDCVEWLDSREPSSVVYISFGSVVVLKQEEVTEMAYGILQSGLSFLWVLRGPLRGSGGHPFVLPVDFLEQAGERGKVVNWSPQEQVLSHPATACFVTHCGWNSTMEALSSGVPVVARPEWGDQVTNAKYLVDVLKVGVRMGRGHAENRTLRREEVKRCLREATAGEKAAAMRENASRWKKAAEEAVAAGGSSDRNLQEFVDEIRRRSGGL